MLKQMWTKKDKKDKIKNLGTGSLVCPGFSLLVFESSFLFFNAIFVGFGFLQTFPQFLIVTALIVLCNFSIILDW